MPRVENLRGSSRGSQARVQTTSQFGFEPNRETRALGGYTDTHFAQGRSESNHSWAHDFRDPIRSASRREDILASSETFLKISPFKAFKYF